MQRFDLHYFLEKNAAFSELSAKEKKYIGQIAVYITMQNKSMPFRIVKDSIYMVTKGELNLHFVYVDGNKEFVKTISAGELWSGGENGFDKEVEYVFIECAPNTQVILLRTSDLYYQVSYRNIYRKLKKILSIEDPLAKAKNDETRLISMKLLNEKELQHRVVGTQYFVVTLLLSMCGYVFMLTSAEEVIRLFKTSTPATLMISFLGLFLCAWALKRGHIPLKAIGLTLTNTKAAVKDALLSLIPCCVIAILFKLFLITFIPLYQHLNLIDISLTISHMGGLKIYLLLIGIYLFVVAPLQEFICRGFIQGSLQQIFWSERSSWTPILTSNLFFAVTHLMISPFTAIIVFFPGVIWGWLFARHNNLIGVTLAHGLLGGFAFFILGYSEFLEF